MIRIIMCGIGGRIGRTMYTTLLKNKDFKLVCGIDKMANTDDFDIPVFKSFEDVDVSADVIIDFSKPEAVFDILPYAVKHNLKAVIATTGHTSEQMTAICDAAKHIAIFKASNMSLGVNLLANLSKDACKFLGTDFDIEIIEQHHNLKVDSPSGTALTLAKAVASVRDGDTHFVYGRHDQNKRREKSEIGIHAIRGGAIVGKHDVMFIGNGEIITLSHEAMSKEVFVVGSLKAAEFLMSKKTGLFDMNSILGSLYAVTNVSVENNITLISIPEIAPDCFNKLLDRLSDKDINLDMISQTLSENGNSAVSFTLSDADKETAYAELYKIGKLYFAKENTCKITSEGAGMEHQSGVAAEIFNILNKTGAKLYSITTSETKISCCTDVEHSAQAEAALKKYYKI